MASGSFNNGSSQNCRLVISWSSIAGTGGSTVTATLKGQNQNGWYFHANLYANQCGITINGTEVKNTSTVTLSTSANGTATFISTSVWVPYTGNKSITISGFANFGSAGIVNLSNQTISSTVALDKVGSAPTLTKMTAPTTQVISETSSTITVSWEKATSYNNACTYGIGVSINGGAYSYVYPDNNINTTSYTYTISNKTQGTTYKFAVVAANDVAQSNVIESGTVTINKLEPPTIADIATYNPFVTSALSVGLSGGSQLNSGAFYRCAALYYGDELLASVVPTSTGNTSVSITYSSSNYISKLGKTKYSDTFKIIAWSQNGNGSKSANVSKTFTVNINSDGGATPTLGAPTLSGGALSNAATCFIKGISTLTVTSATGAARRSPSGVTLSYSIGVSGSYSQSGSSASWSELSAGTKTITVTCTDSRGLSTSVTKQCVIQDYSPPTIKSMSVARLSDPNTSAKATYELYYSPIYQYTDVNTKGNQLNGINSQQYRLNGGAWGNYTSGTTITGLSVDSTYRFELRCADKVKTSTYTTSSVYTIYTISHELSLRKGRLGIMCVPQSGYALDVKGKARFTAGIESPVNTSSYLDGSKGVNVLVNSTATGANYKTFLSGPSTNGRFSLSMYQDRVMVGYQAQSSIDAGTNALTKYINLLQEDGTSVFNTIRCANELRVGSTFGAGEGTIPGVALGNGGTIELSGSTPYIDFHYNNSSDDYTYRIIGESSYLSIYGDFRAVNNAYFDSNTWVGNVYMPGGSNEWIGFYKSDRSTRYCWIGRNGSSNTKFYFTGEDNVDNFYFNKPITHPGMRYSTSEQWTGEYWIDDKKIYQKTVTWSNLSAGSISKAHNISNIDSIVDYKISAKNSGGELFTFPCVYYGNGSSGTFYDTYMFVTKTYVNCKSNIAWSSHEFYATIYYTKTS